MIINLLFHKQCAQDIWSVGEAVIMHINGPVGHDKIHNMQGDWKSFPYDIMLWIGCAGLSDVGRIFSSAPTFCLSFIRSAYMPPYEDSLQI
jgi:hypothetical protein